jgi:hypothetical protein
MNKIPRIASINQSDRSSTQKLPPTAQKVERPQHFYRQLDRNTLALFSDTNSNTILLALLLQLPVVPFFFARDCGAHVGLKLHERLIAFLARLVRRAGLKAGKPGFGFSARRACPAFTIANASS